MLECMSRAPSKGAAVSHPNGELWRMWSQSPRHANLVGDSEGPSPSLVQVMHGVFPRESIPISQLTFGEIVLPVMGSDGFGSLTNHSKSGTFSASLSGPRSSVRE